MWILFNFQVAVAYNNNDICTFDLDSLLPSIQTDENNQIQQEVEFSFIYNGFHSGSISSMDICTQRPILVTACQSDSSIRIWNYQAMRCELAKKFSIRNHANPLLSVAIHPNGYYLAAGFTDKVRIFYLMSNQLRIYREIALSLSNCIKFSYGGQILACTYQSDIHLFQSYTLEKLYTLKSPTPITQMLFTKNVVYFEVY
jgi:WD40 repeat protein